MILPTRFDVLLDSNRFEGHDVALSSLRGSQNYFLDELETSDFDYMIYVFPNSYEVFKKMQIQNKLNYSADGKDLEVVMKDFRELAPMLDKQNLTVLEMLSGVDVRIADNIYLAQLLELAPAICRMNLPKFFASALGSAREMFKRIENRTEDTAYYFNTFGYNPKAAMGCKRILDAIVRFAKGDFDDLNLALRYFGKEREAMLDIKHGKHTLTEIKVMLDIAFKEAQAVAPVYDEHTVNEITRERMWDLCYKAYELNMHREANEKYVSELKLRLDKGTKLQSW